MAAPKTPRKKKEVSTFGSISAKSMDVPLDQGSPTAPLTPMQHMYVKHLIHDRMTQTSAARAAGFAVPAIKASQLMKMPKIQRAIASAKAEYAEASGMDKRKVIEGFTEAIDMARIKGDPIGMVAGWREIGKMCGLYEATKAKLEISVNGQVMLQKMQQMSDEELLRLAEAGTNVLEGEFSMHPAEDETDESANA